MRKSNLALAIALALLFSSALSAYVLLSPRRTWDGAPTLIVDNRGLSSVADGDLGRTRIRNAIVASVAWNGAGTGTRIKLIEAMAYGLPIVATRKACEGLAVEDGVAGRESRRQLVDHALGRPAGRDHDPCGTGGSEPGDELVERRRPSRALPAEPGDRLGAAVVHHAGMAGAHQPPHHVRTHAAETDHAELHGSRSLPPAV